MRNAGSLVRQTVEIVYKVPFLELLRNKHMITYFLLSNSALFVKLPRRRNLWTRNSVKYSTVHSEQNDRDKTAWKPYGPFCVPSIVTSTDLVQIMLSDSLHWTFKWSLWSFHCVLDNVQCTMTHANAFHPDQSVFFFTVPGCHSMLPPETAPTKNILETQSIPKKQFQGVFFGRQGVTREDFLFVPGRPFRPKVFNSNLFK